MIAVYGAPYLSQAPQTALSFAKALKIKGHNLQVFFYHESVQIASPLSENPVYSINLHQAWSEFGMTHHTELMVCSTAAKQFGLYSESSPEILTHHPVIKQPFICSGLGELTAGILASDRFIVFGD